MTTPLCRAPREPSRSLQSVAAQCRESALAVAAQHSALLRNSHHAKLVTQATSSTTMHRRRISFFVKALTAIAGCLPARDRGPIPAGDSGREHDAQAFEETADSDATASADVRDSTAIPAPCLLDCATACVGRASTSLCGNNTCHGWTCARLCESAGPGTWCCNIQGFQGLQLASESVCRTRGTGSWIPCRSNNANRCGVRSTDCAGCIGTYPYCCRGICGSDSTSCSARSDCCVDSCGGEYSQIGMTCSGRCVDTNNDDQNCGTCDHACPSGTRCAGGACR